MLNEAMALRWNDSFSKNPARFIRSVNTRIYGLARIGDGTIYYS